MPTDQIVNDTDSTQTIAPESTPAETEATTGTAAEEKFFIEAIETLEDGTPVGSKYRTPEDAKKGIVDLSKGYRAAEKRATAAEQRLQQIEEHNRQLMEHIIKAKPGQESAETWDEEPIQEALLDDPVNRAYYDTLIRRNMDEETAEAMTEAYAESHKAEKQVQYQHAQQEEHEQQAEQFQNKLGEFLVKAAVENADVFLDPVKAGELLKSNQTTHPDYAKALKMRELYQIANAAGDPNKFGIALQLVSPHSNVEEIKKSEYERGKQDALKTLKSSHARLGNIPGATGGNETQVSSFDPSKMTQEELRQYRHAKAEASFTGSE
jgi:hypothetical protein